MKLYLASSSPRRKELLEKYNYEFEVVTKECDESIDSNLSPASNAKSIALKKANAIGEYKDIIVLSCDTMVVLDNIIYGKPKDNNDAYNMLKNLSNKTHEVISGVCIKFNEEIINYSESSFVTFKDLTDDDINKYISTGECFGKAGGYAIQGIGNNLVKSFEGDLENIIGLPMKSIIPHLNKYYHMWKIGNVYIPNKVVLAPMAGICNEAFRLICKEYGCGLVVAEMLSDKALGYQNEKTIGMTRVNKLEHPISMQIFGSSKESMVIAAKWICENSDCDIIDINMGCPVNKVAKKAGSGSSLLKDPDKVYEITKAVVEASDRPVTVKIRLGWDENSINCVLIAKLIEKAGASAIAVHGRTRNQFYSGKANYEYIKQVKEAVSIPVIANGDIIDYKTAKYVLDYTKCDAVMIGRGAQGNPFIFNEIDTYLKKGEIISKPSKKEIYDTIMRHYDYLLKLKGERLAHLEMRTHISQYIKGMPKSSEIKNLVNQEKDFTNVKTLLQNFLLKD